MGSDGGSQGSGNSSIWLGYTQGALPWPWIRVDVSTGLHLYLLFLLRLMEKIPKTVPKQNMETARHNHRMEGEGSGTEKTSLKVDMYFQRQF